MLVHFVVPSKHRRWAYPLLRWRSNFSEDGIDVIVRNHPCTSQRKRADLVFLTSYYYREFFKDNDSFFEGSQTRILADIDRQKGFGSNVIFYDLTAGGSSRQLWPIRHVELFLKRQLLRDKSAYADIENPHRRHPWIPDDRRVGDVCDAQDLPRLQLGWTLGYSDYQTTSRWLMRLNFQSLKEPRYTSPQESRPLLASYRGRSGGARSTQRDKLVSMLASRADPRVVTGDFLNRRRYLDELRACQAVISPFGYGEICYRDFEAFVVGATLIKPSVEHLTTFPEMFIPGETYLPCQWDLGDIMDVLNYVEQNRGNAMAIAQRGQELFSERHQSYSYFADHFKRIVEQATA